MPINVDAAIAKYNGQWNLSFDGTTANAGQCVQLVALICRDNGLPVIWADAAYWFLSFNHPEAYDKIANNPNDPNQLPQKGDIIIWNTNLPNSGGAGHIAVVVSTHAGGFVSFDSNWGGKYAHLVTHNWSYVLGWLHPKGTPQPQGEEMITQDDIGLLRIAHTEVGNWDSATTHAGNNDTQIMNAWHGKPVKDLIWAQWNNGQPHRVNQNVIDNLKSTVDQINQTLSNVSADNTATKAQLQEAIAKAGQLSAELTTAHDKIAELQAQPKPAEVTDQTKAANSIIKFIRTLLGIKD